MTNYITDKINHGSTHVGSHGYDHHTLLIEHEGRVREEVHDILRKVFKQMYTEIYHTKMPENAPYILNSNKPTSCFIYVVSSKDYNVLIGLNPDGSARESVVGSKLNSDEYK